MNGGLQYQIERELDTKLPSVQINSGLTTDLGNSLFVSTPMRFRFDQTYAPYNNNATLTGNPSGIFNGNLTSGMLINVPISQASHYRFTSELSLENNLKHNASGVVFRGRDISIPNNTDTTALHTTILGRVYSAGNVCSLDIYNFQNQDTPQFINPLVNSSGYPSTSGYLGSCRLPNHFHLSVEAPTDYNFITKNYGSGVLAGEHIVDYGESWDMARLVSMGEDNLTGAMGSKPMLGRDLWNVKNTKVTQIFDIWTTNVALAPSETNYYIYEIYTDNHNSASIARDNKIYLPINGLHVKTNSGITSTLTRTGTNLMLYRPYEYLEAIYTKLQPNNVGTTWSGMSAQWNTFYSGLRDNSGFVIEEETRLDEFVKDYCAYEPFVTYLDSANNFNIYMLKPTYVIGDATSVDFFDFSKFEIGITSIDAVKSEIKIFRQTTNMG
jgi:hypothetical protein